jgi:3-isopropylmalate dehydrogenase
VDSKKETQAATKRRIAIIPGDGIGQEVIPQAVKVIQASGAQVALTHFDWGADRYLRDQVTVPPDGFVALGRDFDAILVGAFGDPRVQTNIHAKEILLGMRFKMDLYANVRPVRLLDAALCPLKGVEPKDIDFVVLRENTEGVYTDAGGVFKQGTPDEIATQEDINTRKGVERIIRYAFQYCEGHTKLDSSPRNKVLMCDKSNAMTHAGGLWQRVFKEVSGEYPKITAQHMYVDALCMQMVRDPRQFDVIVTNNMFGDIITDLAAGLQGGLGMAASGNVHPSRTSMCNSDSGHDAGSSGDGKGSGEDRSCGARSRPPEEDYAGHWRHVGNGGSRGMGGWGSHSFVTALTKNSNNRCELRPSSH